MPCSTQYAESGLCGTGAPERRGIWKMWHKSEGHQGQGRAYGMNFVDQPLVILPCESMLFPLGCRAAYFNLAVEQC